MVGITLGDSGGNEVCVTNCFNLVDVKVPEAVIKLVIQLIQKFHNLPFGMSRGRFNFKAHNLYFASKNTMLYR